MFEEYLKNIHAENYMGTDDDMPDDFERWLETVTCDELIEYGNKMVEEMNSKKYIIWSIEHQAWWYTNHRGYVKERGRAGLYSFAEASKIVRNANAHTRNIPNEAMIEVIN